MLAVGLGRGDQGQQLGLADSSGHHDVGEHGLALGDGAGLVQHDHVELVCGLQRFRGADEDAGLGALSGTDHDGQWRGEAERAGTRDDQHRDRGHQREGQRGRRSGHEPHCERDDGDGDHGRHEIGGSGVGQALDRGLGCLRLPHQPNDLGEHRVRADLGRADPQRAGAVDRRSDHGVAGPFGHRHRLAGDHRFVHGRGSGQHGRVDGDLLPGTNHHLITHDDVLDGDFGLDAIANDARGARLQAEQGLDRLTGTGFRACLE